ncbi:hypothetical protein [Gordonia sp. ABSL49_1]|uniref:hypothetical protein n=1 Tax=unclassified Gordonia (in: high G+C Gram-positive bacteria) TaxID=2657482 RepID=UPI001F1026D0|nr:hypothetical protein [Gordonia sp. ABSL49_1]MCH5644453.1 hypothetical protein [Gordonia sp. ABSL49_1]
MPKKYLIAAAGALVASVSAGIAVLLVRRSRREPAPVSATVPRVEELTTTIDSEKSTSEAS